MKLTKKRKKALEKLDALKYYNVEDACDIVKKAANSNFDESVDLSFQIKINQVLNVRCIKYFHCLFILNYFYFQKNVHHVDLKLLKNLIKHQKSMMLSEGA